MEITIPFDLTRDQINHIVFLGLQEKQQSYEQNPINNQLENLGLVEGIVTFNRSEDCYDYGYRLNKIGKKVFTKLQSDKMFEEAERNNALIWPPMPDSIED